jgi:hypothetical protein
MLRFFFREPDSSEEEKPGLPTAIKEIYPTTKVQDTG